MNRLKETVVPNISSVATKLDNPVGYLDANVSQLELCKFEEGSERFSDTAVLLSKMKPIGLGEQILDFGSGPGQDLFQNIAPLAAKTNSTVYGIDTSELMIHHAKTHYPHPNVEYILGNFLENGLELQMQNFDRIISRFALHYIEDYRRLFSLFYKHLKPGGQMAAIVNSDPTTIQLFRRLRTHPVFGKYMKDLPVPDFVDLGTRGCEKAYTACLTEAGFTIVLMVTSKLAIHRGDIPAFVDTILNFNTHAQDLPPNLLFQLREEYVKYFTGNVSAESGKFYREICSFVVQK